MKTITVAQLRQNPASALAEVARGAEYVVVRYREEIARLVPPLRTREAVTAANLEAVLRSTPVDDEWSDELAGDRSSDRAENPWDRV